MLKMPTNTQVPAFFKKYLPYLTEHIPITINVTLLFVFGRIVFDTLKSPEYWNSIFNKLSTSIISFIGIFFISWEYFITTALCLFVIYNMLSFLFKSNTWIRKQKYNPKEHSNLYVADILSKVNTINTEEEFKAFRTDFIESLYNLFRYKSIYNKVSWLKPTSHKRDFLSLFATNLTSNYSPDSHFSFKSGEGVAGNCWKSGDVEYYSGRQQNDYYKRRETCLDKAYVCCPIPEKSNQSKYGIIAVGFDSDVYIDHVDVETLKLMTTALNCVLESISDDLKTELDL